jgi:hypothetical protein
MALDRREVLKTYTFEQQRQEINKLAQDLYDVSRGDQGLEALQLDGPIIDYNESAGTPGQFLKSTEDGVLWKTLSISNVLWVTKDGDDSNDGLSQETAKASIASALRAAKSGYLGKLQDAATQILVNKKLIQEESIGWLLTEYSSFTFPNSPPESGRYKDGRNLIYKNIDEICDKALAEIAVQYDESIWGQNWIFPGDSVSDESQRFKDAYRLIQKNRTYIIDEAFNFLTTNYPNFVNPNPDKCKRDIGYYIDAVSLDLYLGGNKYSRKFVSFYYENSSIVYLDGELTESIATFNEAKDLMIQAIKNLLPYADSSITEDTDPNGICVNVEQSIISLNSLIVDVFENGISNLDDYPETSGDLLLTNELKCRRDINYIVRSVANDLYTGGNSNIFRATKKYFNEEGNFIFINNESIQSKIAFEKAGELMKMAVTNQLYEKNLDLPESQSEYGGTGEIITYGVSGNPATCVDVQFTIDTLILIITTAIEEENLSVLDEIEETDGIWADFENICLRDIGYIIDAIASDLKNGGNVNCTEAGNSYYKGNSLVFIDGEVEQTLAAFEKAKELMILSMRNWKISEQENTYTPTFSFIDPYIDQSLIVEVDEENNVIYPSCADVESAIENYFNIIEYIIQNGANTVEQQLPTFKTTIFVKSGVYTEQNPIILPPNTGIVGDNLREVTIFPANPTEDVFYLNNGSYITGATFSGHLFPSVVGSFPKVKVGDSINLLCFGTENQYSISVSISKDLYEGMTVSGDNIGTGAVITKILNNIVFLSVANTGTFENQSIKFENNIGTVGIITRSPYIQNCTSITSTGAGLRVDGNLASGLKSFVLDSYTQYNQGGDGIIIVNQGYTQLVSIFEICCDRAVYLSGGSTCSITNSNTDFGNFGLIADGRSPLQYVGKIDGNQQVGNTVRIKNLRTEPYVGQVITFGNDGNPYYFVQQINIINGGEGYDSSNPPFVVIDNPSGPNGILAQAIPNIENGVITSITLISSGSQYIDIPNVTIVGGNPTIQAEAVAKVYPQYYSIIATTDLDNGTSVLTLDETVPFNLDDDTDVYFYQLTKIIANSHCFEYVGAGTQINQAIPARGGVPIQENEVVELNGGKVSFTSTDHLGNFRIGEGIQINQNTGTISGSSFERSIFTTISPFILALS